MRLLALARLRQVFGGFDWHYAATACLLRPFEALPGLNILTALLLPLVVFVGLADCRFCVQRIFDRQATTKPFQLPLYPKIVTMALSVDPVASG